ncbi:MAG: JDVT-CTERM system glutamic-type intramembrane protease [Nitrospira sp.]|nr:JDVT-CTERM system glutamic-type intramembrane protease [Nitrospira sp.]
MSPQQRLTSNDMGGMSHTARAMALLGLQYTRPFHRDALFLFLFALGPTVWLSMAVLFALQPSPRHALWSPVFLSVALWQPLFEELLFRGVIQGHLLESMPKQKTWLGLSSSNLLTSCLFSLAHLANHSVSWSLLVFLPSLCFGFVRDRFGSVYPSIILHAFYNSGYFLLIGSATRYSS